MHKLELGERSQILINFMKTRAGQLPITGQVGCHPPSPLAHLHPCLLSQSMLHYCDSHRSTMGKYKEGIVPQSKSKETTNKHQTVSFSQTLW